MEKIEHNGEIKYLPPGAGEEIKRINPTAKEAYQSRGPGIGGGEGALRYYPPPEGSTILDIGFGECRLAKGALKRDCIVFGADIARGSWEEGKSKDLFNKGFIPFLLDVSHVSLPLPDSVIDQAYCLETLEHLSNPFFAFSEIKRVLKHGGKFIVAFPMPESNLGYGPGKHAHVYPGFLLKDSFERFMMQMYFRKLERRENGDSAWYLFENLKEDIEIKDAFFVVLGDNDEDELYSSVKERRRE